MSARTELVRTTLPPSLPSFFMAQTASCTVFKQVRKFHSMHSQCLAAGISAKKPGTQPPAQAKT